MPWKSPSRKANREHPKGTEENGFAPKQPSAEPLLVHTIFGCSIVHPSSEVFVKVGDSFVAKSASCLFQGEEVLFEKEGIPGVTLSDIESALSRSARYVATAPVLFRKLDDGTYTPAFRMALFDGMHTASDQWPPSLQSVRVSAGTVPYLSDGQERDAARCIRERLRSANDGFKPVTESHIRYGWLGGRVIAPRGKDEVFKALVALAPALGSLATKDFEDAYNLYVRIRQAVMANISLILHGKENGRPENGRSGNGDDETPETKGHVVHVSVKPEIAIVARHFASEVSSSYAAARVLKISPLKRPEGGASNHDGEGILTRGIMTAKDRTGIRIKDVNELLEELSVLRDMSYRVFFESLDRDGILDWEDFLANYNTELDGLNAARQLYFFSRYVADKLAFSEAYAENQEAGQNLFHSKLKGTPLKSTYVKLVDPKRTVELELLERAASKFVALMDSGLLDRRYGLPEGTIAKMLDQRFKIDLALPLDFNLLGIIGDARMLFGLDGKDLQPRQMVMIDVFDRLEEEVHRKYPGIPFRPLMAVPTAFCILSRLHVKERYESEIYAGKMTVLQALDKLGFMDDVRGMMIRDEKAIAVLERAGFASLIPLYPTANRLLKPFPL